MIFHLPFSFSFALRAYKKAADVITLMDLLKLRYVRGLGIIQAEER